MADETKEEGKESQGQGGGGGSAGGGEKKPSEADALIKAELEESRRELKKLREAEEKRTKKELEDQGSSRNCSPASRHVTPTSWRRSKRPTAATNFSRR